MKPTTERQGKAMYGKKVWFFPDGERPPQGESEMKGHESIVILNPNGENATVRITIYFDDRAPIQNIFVAVDAERVRCLRTDEPKDFGEHTLPIGIQYALKLESDVPIIAQYGRLDNRQANLAFYTTMGWSVAS